MRTRVLSGLALAAVAALAGVSQAAVITITRVETSTAGGSLSSAADLTAIGGTDWVIFSKGDNSSQVAVANRKNGGSLISNIASSTSSGGASLGGDTFSYTDGTAPVFVPAVGGGAMIKGEGSNRFFSFTVPISNASGTLDVWFSVQQATNTTLTVTDGTTPKTDSLAAGYGDGASRLTAHNRINFAGASGDILTVTYASTGGDYNGKIGFDAAALSIPEPATLGLVGLAGLALLRRRRTA